MASSRRPRSGWGPGSTGARAGHRVDDGGPGCDAARPGHSRDVRRALAAPDEYGCCTSVNVPALLVVELQCGRRGRGCHHRTGVTTAVLGAVAGVDVGGDLGRRVTDVLDGDVGFQTRHADTGPA